MFLMKSKCDFSRGFRVYLTGLALLLTASFAHAHSGPLNNVAMKVCEAKVRSQACQYEGGHNDLYIGTCQYISDTDLICVRNKPIQKIESEKAASEEGHEHKDGPKIEDETPAK